MNRLQLLWSALESLSGAAAVASEWRRLCGSEFGFVQQYLIPGDRVACTFPRPDGGYPPYTIVEHGPNDIIGVCPENSCDQVALTRADLVVYRLNARKLGRALALALQLAPMEQEIDTRLPMTYQIGQYRPAAGFAFPAFLSIQLDHAHFARVVQGLVSFHGGSFLLLAPTERHCDPLTKQLLERQKCCLLPLRDAVASSSEAFQATPEGMMQLMNFRACVLPSDGKANGVVFFPTPADVRWCDLQIRFIDGHTVSIKIGAAAGLFHYVQMGMADGRSARPTKQWELLRAFARNYGILTWKSPDADRRNQKRREYLARDLKAFFRIDGDPIELTSDGKGWRTVFAVEPDA